MCIVDWAILGAWAQVGAVLLAAGIALSQLNKFTEGERVKNTIALLREFNYDTVDVSSIRLTAAAATSALCGVSLSQRYAGLRANPASTRTPQDEQTLENIESAAIIFHNYFDGAADLFTRNLIDRNLFVSRLSLMLLTAHVRSRTIIQGVQPGNLDVSSMKSLIRASLSYRRKIGDTNPEFADVTP